MLGSKLIVFAALVALALAVPACQLIGVPVTVSPVPTSTAPVVVASPTTTVAASPTAVPPTARPATASPAPPSPLAASPTAATLPTAGPPIAASPAATPTCVALDPQFQPLQARAEAMKDVFPYAPTLDCPLRPSFTTQGALQEFRFPITSTASHPKINYMLWRQDKLLIYLLVKNDQSTGASHVYTYQDTWTDQDPRVPAACADIIPQQDVPPATDPSRAMQVPVRGFGKVWCNEKWQDAIGFGNGKEVGGTFTIQETVGGLYMAVPRTDGRETVTLFLMDTDRGGALAP